MNNESKLIPELRFPEFVNEGEWQIEPLGKLSQEIIEKTKGRKYKLMSITSGIGLVSQLEKFGREIAGNSYKNYYVIHNGDFAYNKSSTKLYSEGEIALFEDDEVGAVPNSIFTCFRFNKKKVFSTFAKYPFVNNLHGNWLRKFIAVGARANGALQVNSKDLFSVPFTYPNLPEQQKIAACLSSLDEVITAHSKKLESLKNHKKGLMQNLFPQEGETVPAYRFPEFMDDGEWVDKALGGVAELTSSKRVHLADYVSNGIPFFRGKEISQLKNNHIPEDILYISEKHYDEIKDKYGIPRIGDILITAVGTLANVYCVKNNDKFYFKDGNLIWMKNIKINSSFLEVLLDAEKEKVLASAIGSSQKALTMAALNKLEFKIPNNIKEQQKIASCLSSLDELIAAQTEKIAQLQLHKKGLMQGLFPKN